jgi:hypothetical protein
MLWRFLVEGNLLMKQRTRVLLALFSASFLLACMLLAIAPVSAFVSTYKNPPSNKPNAAPKAQRERDSDDRHPARALQKVQQDKSLGQNLGYAGGPVMTGTTHTYAIFWEPNGNVEANYNHLINRYFNDIGTSPLYQIARQYKQANGAFPVNAVAAASWVDTRAYPKGPVLDSDIQQEVLRAQKLNGWQSSMHNIFFVFTGRNKNVCMDGTLSQCTSNGYCAYHSAFGANTIYSAIPYIASFNCDPFANPNHNDADKSITGISHEQIEAATDPLGDAWLDAGGNEVADKCASNFGQPNAQGADVIWNNHLYMVQKEWDNHTGTCRLTPSRHR